MSSDQNLALTLDRIALAACVTDDVLITYELPSSTEERADLLLAVEDLAVSIAKLHKSISDAVWETPHQVES
jgi:hypothetical protein